MQEINFLPKEYREAAVKRQGKMWHLVVLLLFGGAVSGATLLQVSARHKVAQQLEIVEPQFEAATQATAELGRLQSELKKISASAQLCVYLEAQWPTTQVLVAAVGGVPDSVRLTQLRYGRENLQEQAGIAPGRPPARGNEAEQARQARESMLQAQRDLADLRDKARGQQLVVLLEGITADSAQLYDFSSQLARQPLVAKAEILSLEGTQRGEYTISTFRMRLILRPTTSMPPTQTERPAATASLTQNLP